MWLLKEGYTQNQKLSVQIYEPSKFVCVHSNNFLPDRWYSYATYSPWLLLQNIDRISATYYNLKYLINKEETVVYLNYSPKRTGFSKGEKTVSVFIDGSLSTRFKFAVAVARDRTNLSLFIIFKGGPGGLLERSRKISI